MEALLVSIERKLDLKADTSRVDAMDEKISLLDRQFTDFITGRVLTPTGTEYLRRFTEMERSIETLEQSDSNRNAVSQAIKESADVRYRSLLWVVGIATILNLVSSVVLRFIQ